MGHRSLAFPALALAIATMLPRGEARADFVLNLGTVINGTAPTGTAPYVTASFHTVSTGTVTVTISASGLTSSSEYAHEFLFNVAPTITPSSLTYVSTSGPTATISATTDDAYDGGSQIKAGLFDVLLSYANNSLTGTSASSVITITGDSITAESFLFKSTPDSNTFGGPYYAAADIRGIPGSLSGSIGTTTAVPEPSSLALAGIGLAGGFGLIRRRRSRIAA